VNASQRDDGGSSGHAGPPRVAIVHDYLTQRGGAERAVLSLCRAFPDAPLYTSLYEKATTFAEFREQDVRPLWLNRVRPFRRRHRLALPVLPFAFGRSRVDADVVICSSSGWAHGIRTNGRKVVYCYSPAKWLYRPDDYLGARPRALVRQSLRLLTPYLRRFDARAASSAETYVAISTFIADQVREVYGIDAEVLCPPAGLQAEGPQVSLRDVESGFFLTVARLLPYKHVGEIIGAFRALPRERLVVVGDGPERGRLASTAPANVRLIQRVDDGQLRWLYAHSAGLIAASREDFGLTPVEAAGFGKPSATLRWGGFLDTVVPEITGVFFESPEPGAIASAVEQLASKRWDADAITRHSAEFSEERFVERIREIVLAPG
jgi:glycosyltransferase involved in cell wall biosynthesis